MAFLWHCCGIFVASLWQFFGIRVALLLHNCVIFVPILLNLCGNCLAFLWQFVNFWWHFNEHLQYEVGKRTSIPRVSKHSSLDDMGQVQRVLHKVSPWTICWISQLEPEGWEREGKWEEEREGRGERRAKRREQSYKTRSGTSVPRSSRNSSATASLNSSRGSFRKFPRCRSQTIVFDQCPCFPDLWGPHCV